MTPSASVYDADLFTDDALADPYSHYRAIRDAGPVVWLSAHDGPPERKLNNLIRSFRSLPVTVKPT